jgi:WD40 repeat protein
VNVKTGVYVRVAFSPDCTKVAAIDFVGDDRVEVYDTATGKIIATFPQSRPERSDCLAIAFSPGGDVLAASADNLVNIWDVTAGRKIATLGRWSEGILGHVTTVAFSPDGKTIASGMLSLSKIDLWDVQTHTIKASIADRVDQVCKAQGIRTVAFSPDGRIVASGRRDGSIELWDIQPAADAQPPAPDANAPATPTP